MEGESAPEVVWAKIEIMGHRTHYGRVTEVERFGTKMMRVDVPLPAEKVVDGEGQPEERFATFYYGGGSLFSFTPMTEEAARAWAKRQFDDGRSVNPLALMPPEPYRATVYAGDDGDDDLPL